MTSTRPSPEDIRKLRELATAWGKVIARRAFGPQGPGADVSLSVMEELALEVSRGLVEGTLQTLLEQQAQTLGTEHPCPDWMRGCWQGEVAGVTAELALWQEKLGRPPPGEKLDENDPVKLLAEGLTYLSNNQDRMDYPRYRKQGLPVTSSLVESLVGEFNARVKDKNKHWDRPAGGEAILPLRAAVLSEDDRLIRFFANRPGCLYRRRPSIN